MVTVAGSPFPLWVGKESSELSEVLVEIAGDLAEVDD